MQAQLTIYSTRDILKKNYLIVTRSVICTVTYTNTSWQLRRRNARAGVVPCHLEGPAQD